MSAVRRESTALVVMKQNLIEMDELKAKIPELRALEGTAKNRIGTCAAGFRSHVAAAAQ